MTTSSEWGEFGYRMTFATIQQFRIVKVTKHQVRYVRPADGTEAREERFSRWHRWYPSLEKAQAGRVRRAERDVERARYALMDAEEILAGIRQESVEDYYTPCKKAEA